MVVERVHYKSTDFLAWSALPENQNRLFELIHGEIFEKVVSFKPAKLILRIQGLIGNFLDQNPVGYVTGAEDTYVLADEHAFMPDVGYISRARLPEEPEREVLTAPDLAIEVKAPTDSKRAMRNKAEIYLAFGTQMVWLVFPDERLVEVYMSDHDVIEVRAGGTLDGGELLPGFKLAVNDIFGG